MAMGLLPDLEYCFLKSHNGDMIKTEQAENPMKSRPNIKLEYYEQPDVFYGLA